MMFPPFGTTLLLDRARQGIASRVVTDSSAKCAYRSRIMADAHWSRRCDEGYSGLVVG
jgi:hypothetical protein